MKIIKHFMSNTFNIGDFIITDAVDKLLAKYMTNSFKLIKVHQQSSALYQNFKGVNEETLNFIAKPDVVLIGGHPIIGAKRLLDIETAFDNVPGFLIGVGARLKMDGTDELEPGYESYMKPHLECMKAISVRDRHAYEFCKKYNENTFLTGCPALFSYEIPFSYKKTDYCCICYDKHYLNEAFYENLIERLQKRNLKVFFLVHDYRDMDVGRRMAEKTGCYFIATPDYRYFKSFLENAKLVVAMRLHGMMLSSTLGAPFIHVYNILKGEEFSAMFDPEHEFHVHHRIEKLDHNDQSLMGKVNRFVKKYQKAKSHLTKNDFDALDDIEERVDRILKEEIDYPAYHRRVREIKKQMVSFLTIMDQYI